MRFSFIIFGNTVVYRHMVDGACYYSMYQDRGIGIHTYPARFIMEHQRLLAALFEVAECRLNQSGINILAYEQRCG